LAATVADASPGHAAVTTSVAAHSIQASPEVIEEIFGGNFETGEECASTGSCYQVGIALAFQRQWTGAPTTT
jgi:hypothetical protein